MIKHSSRQHHTHTHSAHTHRCREQCTQNKILLHSFKTFTRLHLYEPQPPTLVCVLGLCGWFFSGTKEFLKTRNRRKRFAVLDMIHVCFNVPNISVYGFLHTHTSTQFPNLECLAPPIVSVEVSSISLKLKTDIFMILQVKTWAYSPTLRTMIMFIKFFFDNVNHLVKFWLCSSPQKPPQMIHAIRHRQINIRTNPKKKYNFIRHLKFACAFRVY